MPWTIVGILTLLTLLPAIVLSITPMVRLLVVFHFLRQALGTQTAPGNQILMGLGLMMTWFLMHPVLVTVINRPSSHFGKDRSPAGRLWNAASSRRSSTCCITREKKIWHCCQGRSMPHPAKPMDLPLRVVVPAYMLSELKAGFQIGAILFLPFLLVDLVVASITTSIGMLQLPPVTISTPLKILLFVMVDGWNLLADSLLKSFS